MFFFGGGVRYTGFSCRGLTFCICVCVPLLPQICQQPADAGMFQGFSDIGVGCSSYTMCVCFLVCFCALSCLWLFSPCLSSLFLCVCFWGFMHVWFEA